MAKLLDSYCRTTSPAGAQDAGIGMNIPMAIYKGGGKPARVKNQTTKGPQFAVSQR
jgi:hypothetical protein